MLRRSSAIAGAIALQTEWMQPNPIILLTFAPSAFSQVIRGLLQHLVVIVPNSRAVNCVPGCSSTACSFLCTLMELIAIESEVQIFFTIVSQNDYVSP